MKPNLAQSVNPRDLEFMDTHSLVAMEVCKIDPTLVHMACRSCYSDFYVKGFVALRKGYDEEKRRCIKARCPSRQCSWR